MYRLRELDSNSSGVRGYPGTCKRSKRSLVEEDSELAHIYADIVHMQRRLNEVIVGSQR